VCARKYLLVGLYALSCLVWLAHPRQAHGETAYVAVATNFKLVAERLATDYMQKQEDNHQVILTSGSTGKLFTQIVNGAPFHLFLSADQARPKKLVQSGLAVTTSQRTYVLGRLSLVGHLSVDSNTLQTTRFRALAIANPKLAPYGIAAEQAMKHMKIYSSIQGKLVYGENVGQAYALVATGNAELALVARGLVRERDKLQSWAVPNSYHAPIRQDLVLLSKGENNQTARNFMAFILDPANSEPITSAGLELPAP